MAFDSNYASFYNLLYQDKDYAQEAAYVDRLISKQTAFAKPIRLLDLACGTGNHAFLLQDLGYEVNGSDISADMIEVASHRAEEMNSPVRFFNYSFQESHQIKQKYQVIISMFSAINYLTTYQDLAKTLNNIHGLLEDDGIFIFDYWNGNAVTRDYSPLKHLHKTKGADVIERTSRTSLDLINQIAEVEFTCIYAKDGVKQLEFQELHRMRYFYFKELEDLLKANGFKIVYRSNFLNDQAQLDAFDWNITIIVQKNQKNEN
ncbi:MAG: class I SAM-dependent DNA methyltransferase [Sphingobacteriaceae bacterium]